jgi:hypothetical protein
MSSTWKKLLIPVAAIWIGFLAAFLLALVIVLEPQERAKVQLAHQLAEKEHAILRASQAVSVRTQTQLEQNIGMLEDTLNDFVMNLTGSARQAFEISRLAKGMNIDSFSLINTDKEGFLPVAGCSEILAKPFHLSFTASFNGFAGFLNALEKYRPAVFIDTFRITYVPGDASNKQVDMKLLALVSKQAGKRKRHSASAKQKVEP